MRKLVAPTLVAFALAACHSNATVDAGNSTVTDTNGVVTNLDTGNVTTPASSAAIDSKFLLKAIRGDNGEIEIGKLAQAQGSSQKVKDFGKMLQTDHGAHRDKLAAMATAAGLTVPTDPSSEGKKNLAKLRPLHGAAFDSAFKAAMVEDHQKDIAEFEKQSKGKDAQTAAMARDTLPTLRKHLQTAQSL